MSESWPTTAALVAYCTQVSPPGGEVWLSPQAYAEVEALTGVQDPTRQGIVLQGVQVAQEGEGVEVLTSRGPWRIREQPV